MRNTKQRSAIAIMAPLFIIYLVILFKITLYRDGGAQLRGVSIIPFLTIAEYVGAIINGNKIIAIFNLLGNVIIFLPLGFLGASLLPKMRCFSKMLILSLFFSLAIEVCQFIFKCGSSDIDDVILNALGGGLGYGIYAFSASLSQSKKSAVIISIVMIVFSCTGYYARNNFKFILPRPPIIETRDIFINSSNAFLVQLNKGGNKVLFDKDGRKRIYPASMTKIMTAVIALENIKNLETGIILEEKIFAEIYRSNSSVAGFLPGEKVRAIDLLYGLLLPSGGECAIGLAKYVSGTENAFIDLMNKKARQLCMYNTHFTNTVGLHDENHYSTAEDITILLEYAIKNDTFYKIFTTAKHSTRPTNLHKDGITFYSTLFSNMESGKINGGAILGGKTGYTSEAGQCLASYGEKNGESFILVTCGAPGDNKTQQLHIEDAITVFREI